jgi:hypothetical protein
MTDIVEEMRDAMKSAKALGPTDQQGVPTGEIVDYHMLAQAAYAIVERRIGELTEAARFAHTTLVEQQVARIARQELRAGGLADKVSAVVNKLRASLEQRSDQ